MIRNNEQNMQEQGLGVPKKNPHVPNGLSPGGECDLDKKLKLYVIYHDYDLAQRGGPNCT